MIATTVNETYENYRRIMKITQPHYEKAYQLGRMLHEDRIDMSAAGKELVRNGLNRSSGSNLLRNVRHMLRGECYRRKMSIPATKHYLSCIQNDDGEQGLARAIEALRKHIAYYMSLYGDRMQGHQSLFDSYGAPDRSMFAAPEELASVASSWDSSTRSFSSQAGALPDR